MKRSIIIAAAAILLASTIWSGAQMFAQLFGATGTPIKAAGWWKLDGDALDSSGNGKNGTWAGTTAYADGAFAGTQAASFNGSSQIAIGSPVIGQSDFTFCAHFKAAGPDRDKALFGQFLSGSPGRAGLYTHAGGTMRLSIGANSDSTTNKFAAGEWKHIAIVYAAATKTTSFYFDGALDRAVAQASNGSVDQQPMFIGALASGVFRFAGLIQDVRAFNQTLSPANIARIMSNQNNEPLEELQ